MYGNGSIQGQYGWRREMSRMRLGIGAAVLASAFALLWFLPVLETDPTRASFPTQKLNQERQRILRGLSDGQILYIKSVEYERRDPDAAEQFWTRPERAREETWMAEDDNGALSMYSTLLRDANGDVVSYSQLENGQRVTTWKASGIRVPQPLGEEESLAWWVVRIWQTRASLADSGYELVGTGRWYGQPTAINERKTTIRIQAKSLSASQRESMGISPDQRYIESTFINTYEYMVDRPIHYRTATWSTDEEGARTLTEEFRIVEYRLLPADTPIGPFDK